MTDERRGDDSRIDEILRTVGHIDSSIRDHERRISENEKDMIRVKAAQAASDKLTAEITRTLHSKIDGIQNVVASTNTKIDEHMDQERKDKAAIFMLLTTVLLSVLGSVGWATFTTVFEK